MPPLFFSLNITSRGNKPTSKRSSMSNDCRSKSPGLNPLGDQGPACSCSGSMAKNCPVALRAMWETHFSHWSSTTHFCDFSLFFSLSLCLSLYLSFFFEKFKWIVCIKLEVAYMLFDEMAQWISDQSDRNPLTRVQASSWKTSVKIGSWDF